MSRTTATIRRTLLALAVLALGPGAPAQEKPRAPKSQFFETVQVNLISVEVFVTDRSGRPVLGLRREDFEVFEDGHPVAITNFFASDATAPALGAGAAPEAAAAPAAAPTPAAEPEVASPEIRPVEQRLSVVVLVDNQGITGAERKLALNHARELIVGCLKVPHTQAMVVTLDASAHVRQGFTAEPQLLTAALDRAEGEPTIINPGGVDDSMIERSMARISLPNAMSDALAPSIGRRAENRDFAREDAHAILETIRSNAEAEQERTRATLVSVVNFVSSLAGLPGRKIVVYVGGGLNLHPGWTMFSKWDSRFGHSGVEPGFSPAAEVDRLSLSGPFRELVARANADRVTFYAIDAGGTVRVQGPSAEQAELDPDPGATNAEAMGREGSLQYLTSATGGTTITSTPRPTAAVARALSDLDTYYSLAYPAPRIGDGMSHSIRVKVHRDGVTVRHRQNYLDKTADDRVIERNLAALVHNSGVNSLGLEVTVGAAVPQKNKAFAVPLIVAVPLGELVLVPEGEKHTGSITVFVSAKDLDDRITPPIKRQFTVHIPREKLQAALGEKATCSFVMLMARGPQTVAVSVRDDLAQAESTVTARFTVTDRTSKTEPKQVM